VMLGTFIVEFYITFTSWWGNSAEPVAGFSKPLGVSL